jgi:transcription elongation factor Elf1
MNSLWIQKKLECDEYTIQLTCPFCHDDKLFTHKDSEKMPKYCPMCGARMDLTDASDAELVDMLQDVIKGKDDCIDYLRTQLELTTEDKHYFVKEVLHKEEINTELAAAVAARDEQIASLKCQLDAKDEELFTKHNEYAELRHEYDLLNAVFEDMKKVLITIRPHEWAKIAKKYNEEH